MIEEKDINIGTKFTIVGHLPDGAECSVTDRDGNVIIFTVTRVVCDNYGHIKNVWCDKDINGEEHDGFNELDIPLVIGSACLIETKKSSRRTEQVSHPSHYSWLKDLCGVEPIDICRYFGFSIGNALKYLMRKDKADGDKTKTEKRVEDLRKAVFYIEDEIKRLENGKD